MRSIRLLICWCTVTGGQLFSASTSSVCVRSASSDSEVIALSMQALSHPLSDLDSIGFTNSSVSSSSSAILGTTQVRSVDPKKDAWIICSFHLAGVESVPAQFSLQAKHLEIFTKLFGFTGIERSPRQYVFAKQQNLEFAITLIAANFFSFTRQQQTSAILQEQEAAHKQIIAALQASKDFQSWGMLELDLYMLFCLMHTPFDESDSKKTVWEANTRTELCRLVEAACSDIFDVYFENFSVLAGQPAKEIERSPLENGVDGAKKRLGDLAVEFAKRGTNLRKYKGGEITRDDKVVQENFAHEIFVGMRRYLQSDAEVQKMLRGAAPEIVECIVNALTPRGEAKRSSLVPSPRDNKRGSLTLTIDESTSLSEGGSPNESLGSLPSSPGARKGRLGHWSAPRSPRVGDFVGKEDAGDPVLSDLSPAHHRRNKTATSLQALQNRDDEGVEEQGGKGSIFAYQLIDGGKGPNVACQRINDDETVFQKTGCCRKCCVQHPWLALGSTLAGLAVVGVCSWLAYTKLA